MTFKKLIPLFIALYLHPPVSAEQFGPLEISGFVLQEVNKGTYHSLGYANPSTYDQRGIDPVAGVNQPGPTRSTGINTNIQQLTVGLHYEFDSAIRMEGKISKRWRNGQEDVYGVDLFEESLAISHPEYGEFKIGTQPSRVWSREDAFSYPLGLSSRWSESGAGYNILDKSLRYTSPTLEHDWGKLTLEFTYGYNDKNPLNTVTQPYAPWGITGGVVNSAEATNTAIPYLLELFAQYSKERFLMEYIFQYSKNGWQSSWAKGAFVGGFGNPDTPVPANSPRELSEYVHILEGEWYFKDQWKFTYGARQNYWSGAPSICDWNTVVSINCSWPYPGFNYGSNPTTAFRAVSWDGLLGLTRYDGIWTYTAGLVYLGTGHTSNPIDWGQNNSALFTNFGVYRKIPELYKDLTAYVEFEHLRFSNQGPAPLSMPTNTAYFVDPRVHTIANTIILGAKITF